MRGFSLERCRRSHTQGKTGPGNPPESLNCSVAITGEVASPWLSRSSSPGFGKIRNPQYRIAVADARTRRDGRSIEVIGRYHPKEEPEPHRDRLGARAVLAGRRRPAHRARPGAAEDHR